MVTRPQLKKIEFEGDTEVHILSIDPSRLLISWKLKKTSQDLKNLYFFILRGESPSELEQLNGQGIPGNTLYEYVDTTGKLKSYNKNYYYQVVAREIVDGVTVHEFKAKVSTWQGELDLVATYIIEEHLFAYEHVFGTPAFIYKKKNEGTRCPECWDTVLKRVTRSNCSTCLSTGFIGGYYKPIASWMDFSPDPTSAQIMDFGIRELNQSDVQFTNYPYLQLGDIILELEPLTFWRVINSRGSEKNRTTVLQVARVDAVNKSDIEQFLEVDQKLRMEYLEKLNVRQRIPEF